MLGSMFGSGGMFGASGAFAGALSDRSMKTDITKSACTSRPACRIYAYRYKGDPKTYPKAVGPMAEDVAKKFGARRGRADPRRRAARWRSTRRLWARSARRQRRDAGGGMTPGGPRAVQRPRGVSLPTPNLGALASGPLARRSRSMASARSAPICAPRAGARPRRPRMPQIRGGLGG